MADFAVSVKVRWWATAETPTPWLYSSLAEGITKLTLPLLGDEDDPAVYTVKLHFADTRSTNDPPSTFSVTLNGESVLSELTLTQSNKTSEAIVHEINNVTVTDSLTVELNGRQGTTLLNAVEVVRTD